MLHPHRPRRGAAVLLLALTAIGAPAAAPASAATPFAVGKGAAPKIAVGPDGRGHVAWVIPQQTGQPSHIGYCRIPAGGVACDATATIDFPTSGDVPYSDPNDLEIAVPSATKVVITAACGSCAGVAPVVDRIYAMVSTDGGATFTGQFLGSTPTAAGLQEGGLWLDAPGLLVTPGEGTKAIVAGSGASVTPGVAVVGPSFVYNPSVAQVPGATTLVYAANDLGQIQYAVFTGALAVGELSDPARWLVSQTLTTPESDSGESVLTSGPSGLWLAYQRKVPGQGKVLLRRFDAGTNAFGASATIVSAGSADASPADPDVSEDASGRLHAVWRGLVSSEQLRYTRSGTDGTGFGAAVSLASGEAFADLDVAAGADGSGWAVWHGMGDSPVRAVPLAIDAGPVPGGAMTTTTATVPGASIDFGTPKACVQPGSPVRVTLKWKRKKRKGNLFVKVSRADFYIGAKVVKIDRTAPFVQTLKVTASARRGSTITLRARAFIKVRHGKAPKKSITAKLKVCA